MRGRRTAADQRDERFSCTVSVDQFRRVLAFGQSRRMESQMILRDACGASFTLNKNLLRPVRTGHQGMKRTDNETRKRDVTDKARKQGILACGSWAACEDVIG